MSGSGLMEKDATVKQHCKLSTERRECSRRERREDKTGALEQNSTEGREEAEEMRWSQKATVQT